MTAAVVKYVNICRASLIERLAYRGDFLLGTVLRFLPMVTQILLWQAVYLGSGQESLEGFRYEEMIAYLLLTHISRMFSSMPGLAAGIARDIRDGSLKRYLLQPIDMIGYLLAYRVAHKIAYILTSALPYGLVFWICRDYFRQLPDVPTFVAYVLSLFLGFLIGFFFETAMGMVGFWILEITSLLYVVGALNYFVSGHMFPLDLLGGWLATIFKALPFQYMAYFPAVLFLGKVPPDEIARALWLEAVWVVVFAGLTLALYRLGLRRYSAYGG